jgi:curved DNA-binding protein CbpA
MRSWILICFLLTPGLVFAQEMQRILSPNSNYYQVLGIEPSASSEEIKAAYRTLLRKYHPDHYAQDPQKFRVANELVKKLNVARDTLSDSTKRTDYNRQLARTQQNTRTTSTSQTRTSSAQSQRPSGTQSSRPGASGSRTASDDWFGGTRPQGSRANQEANWEDAKKWKPERDFAAEDAEAKRRAEQARARAKAEAEARAQAARGARAYESTQKCGDAFARHVIDLMI